MLDYKGTSKPVQVCFNKAKEGMMVAVNWQNHLGVCGGHVGRSHANNPKEYKGKNSVDQSFMETYKKQFPDLAWAKCECARKQAHSKKCSCMSDEFLAQANSNSNSPQTKWERSNGICQSHACSRKIPFPRHSQVDQGGCEGVHLSVASPICLFMWECGKCDKGGGIMQILVEGIYLV